MRTLFAPRPHPYYIYAHDYRRTSAGVRVLHMLCDALIRSGFEAYVYAEELSPRLMTPRLTHDIQQMHKKAGIKPIAIYPEVIDANPFGLEACVRYLLNKPGLLAGSGKYPEEDLLFAYAKGLLQPGMPQDRLLYLPSVDLGVFRPNEARARSSGRTCFYRGRHKDISEFRHLIPADAVEITQQYPDSAEAIAELFHSCEYFYCLDASGLAVEAALCGCVAIVIPNPLVSSSFGGDETNSYGVAFGNAPEEVERARATMGLLRDKFIEQGQAFWPQLDHFITLTQEHAQALTRDKPKRITVLSAEPPTGPCPYIRFAAPFAHLKPQWQLSWGIENGNVSQHMLNSADVIVLQRYTAGMFSIDNLKQIFALGKPVIYETDDLLHDMPDYHPQVASARQWRPGIEYAARHAHAVVVSTPYLADKLKALNANVHVLPNYLDVDLFYRAPVGEGEGERKLHIGLLGTSLQGPNFALVDEALRELLARYPGRIKLFFVGWAPPAGWEDHPDAEFRPVIPSYLDYAAALKEMAWDIALIPLADDDFNQSKTAIKWLEYASAGIAGIFSDVSVYRGAVTHGETGLLVPNSPQAWLAALCELIDDAPRRIAMVEAAQAEVREEYDVAKGAAEYGRVYASLLAPASVAAPAPAPAPVPFAPSAVARPATTPPSASNTTRPAAAASAGLRKSLARPLSPGVHSKAAPAARAALPPPLAGQDAPGLRAASPAAVPAPATLPAMPALPARAASNTPGRKLRVAVCSVESTWSPCPQIRLILPFSFMDKQWDLQWAIKDGRFDNAIMESADLVVLHRFTPGLLPQSDLELIFRNGKTVIYETDDLLNEIPDYHSQAADSRKWKPGIEYTVRHAHAVTVSTEFLASKYRPLNSNIHVLPNCVDFDRFYRAVPDRERDTVTIGLLGTSITGPNFALVNNALRVLCARYPDKLRLHFVGWECPADWIGHPAVSYEPFVHAYEDYARKLLEWNWDIAVAPLVNDDFNHSKTPIKYLEYGAAGIATAFSDISVYQAVAENGRTGLLVEESQGAWLQAIESLVTQPALRRRLARTAQADVRKHQSLRANAWLYEQAYRSFAALAPQAHAEPARTPAVLILDRAGDPAARVAALAQMTDGKQSWLPKVILTTEQGELPEVGDQLRYVQFAQEEFDEALKLLLAHDDFDWYTVVEA